MTHHSDHSSSTAIDEGEKPQTSPQLDSRGDDADEIDEPSNTDVLHTDILHTDSSCTGSSCTGSLGTESRRTDSSSMDDVSSGRLNSCEPTSGIMENPRDGSKTVLHKLSEASWLAEASMLLTAFLWGINIPIVKFAIGSLDALTFNALRMVISTIALGIIVAVIPRKSTTDRKTVRRALLSGRFAAFFLVSGIAYPFIFMHGIDYTTSGNTAMLLATMPMWAAMISYVFLGERLPWMIRIGLFIAFCGTATVVIAGGNVSFESENFIGNLLITAAACCWASGTIISSPLLTKMSALRVAFWSSLLSTPIYLLYVSGELAESLQMLTQPRVALAVFYSGLFSTGIAYATWYFGVQRLGSSRAAIYQNLVTFIAVIAGWFLLGEVLTLTQWVGGAVIIAGLFIIRRGKQTNICTDQ